MDYITQKERFMNSLKGKNVDKVPVCSVTQTGTVELMETTGAYWPEAHYDPEKMASLAIAGHETAGFESVRYPFDGTVLAQTLGCTVREGTIDAQPSLIDFPCKDINDVKNVSMPENLLESKRISTILKTTDIVKERVGDDVPIIAGMIGPTGVAYSFVGAINFLTWSITNPDDIKRLFEIGTDVCVEYANALFEHGVDAVCLPDSIVSPDLYPPKLFESMVIPEYKKLNDMSKGMMILHMCGDATDILEPIATAGFDGISIEEKVDVKHAKKVIGNRSCLIGNVSPVEMLFAKSPRQITDKAKQCIEDGVDILAPGCGVAPRTPLINMKAFVSARDEYYTENDFS